MNSSSRSCQWRSAEAEPGLMRVILTPNCVKPAASPIFCFSRPEMTGANSFGYDAICCDGILAISILGISFFASLGAAATARDDAEHCDGDIAGSTVTDFLRSQAS